MPQAAATRRNNQATSTVLEELRRMIISGELLPGQQVRQENMAERLGVSRLPIREALRQLAADGMVSHTPNAGYAVARLSVEQFREIYLMRRVLETLVIEDLPRATPQQVKVIADRNYEVQAAADRLDLPAMRAANQAFHFEIFRLSSLSLVIGEIEKLWTWASPYHAVYLFSPESRRVVLSEHDQMMTALRQGDNAALARLMDQHRHGSETHIGLTLGGGAVTTPMRG